MKRFSIFCAALFVAATSFAAVAYELNGGVTNDDNWLGKGDMWTAFCADAGITLGTLDEVKANANPLSAICTPLGTAQCQAILDNAKWDWLEKYIMDVQNPQVGGPAGAGTVPALTEGAAGATWRYALAAFFVETQTTAWPYSADFSGAGKPEAFMPAWKHGFANPTEPTGEFVLNAPYKEGATFDGWYAAADFSGEKVVKIDATTTGTLYAKWVEYIPTVVEVRALADDTETKVSGVVNFISGKNIYIQDATAGILVYTLETPNCKVGDKIVAKGVKVMYGGAPEVKSAVIESTEAASVAAPTAVETLAPLLGDTELKYFATNITIAGVTIVELDGYNNPTVQDALGNKALCYKMSVDPAEFPVGTVVTVTAVGGWYNGFQFVGDAKNIVKPLKGVKENFTYPTRGKYSLENNWVISMNEDNFVANKPGSNDYVRGMAAKDGIMYFINRETKSIVRVDGKTGDMLEPIVLKGEHLFEKVTGTDSVSGAEKWGAATTLPFNDIKFDQAGNCLIGACVSAAASTQPFMIYLVDLATGECTELINDDLRDNPGLGKVTFRFDAFGAAGDVTKNGVVMAADANDGLNVYRWLITDGVAGEGEQINIKLDPAVDQSLYINIAGFGTAPQIFPQDEEGGLFYVDGFNTLPMLFTGTPDEGATLLDDFIYVPTGVKVWNNNDTISMNANFNGLVEFQVGEEYFLLMVAANNTHSVPSTFALFKFADEDRMFEGMEPLWYFPHNGLGTVTIGCRTAVPSVDVIDDNTAILYLYATNNGYATYTFKTNGQAAAVENVEADKVGAEKVVENGQIFILKNGVKYNALGAEVK